MKKFYFSLLTILGVMGITQGALAQGSCTPLATTPDSVGLYPKDLPDGTVGVPYDEQIDFVMFKDTTVNSPLGVQTIYACTFELIEIQKMPGGMTVSGGGPTYNAGSNPPKWTVNHAPGGTNKGCVRISGTPTDTIADFFVLVKVKVDASFTNPATNGGNCTPANLPPLLPATVTDTIKWKVNNISSIMNPVSASQLNLKVVPNPASGQAAIRMKIAKMQDVQVTVVDLMGREVAQVYNGVATEGTQSYTVDTQTMENGIYLVRVVLDGKSTIFSKFVVKN